MELASQVYQLEMIPGNGSKKAPALQMRVRFSPFTAVAISSLAVAMAAGAGTVIIACARPFPNSVSVAVTGVPLTVKTTEPGVPFQATIAENVTMPGMAGIRYLP